MCIASMKAHRECLWPIVSAIFTALTAFPLEMAGAVCFFHIRWFAARPLPAFVSLSWADVLASSKKALEAAGLDYKYVSVKPSDWPPSLSLIDSQAI